MKTIVVMEAKVDSGSSQLSIVVTMEIVRSSWILDNYFDIRADIVFSLDGLDVEYRNKGYVKKNFKVFDLIIEMTGKTMGRASFAE